MKLQFTTIILIFALNCFSQSGTIIGTLTEKNTNELIIGGVVLVDNTKLGAVSDFDGKYSIKINAGTYNLTCQYTGYSPLRFKVLR